MEGKSFKHYNYGLDEPYKGTLSVQADPLPNTGEIMLFNVNKKLKGGKGKGQQENISTSTVLRPHLEDLESLVVTPTRKLALFEGMYLMQQRMPTQSICTWFHSGY